MLNDAELFTDDLEVAVLCSGIEVPLYPNEVVHASFLLEHPLVVGLDITTSVGRLFALSYVKLFL